MKAPLVLYSVLDEIHGAHPHYSPKISGYSLRTEDAKIVPLLGPCRARHSDPLPGYVYLCVNDPYLYGVRRRTVRMFSVQETDPLIRRSSSIDLNVTSPLHSS